MPTLRRNGPPFFYGWVIVATAFVVCVVISGVWSSFAVFYVALVNDLGWSRATTAGAFSMYALTLGGTAVIAGWLADRFGPRRLMPVGAAILSLGLFTLSRLSEPWQLYLVYGSLIAFGHSCVGLIPSLRLLSNWFDQRRGTAFGLATAGLGLGPLLVLPTIQYLVIQFGWRQSYVFLAAGVLLLAPLTGLLFRQHPREMGQLADGRVEGDLPELQPEKAQSAVNGSRLSSPFADFDVRQAMATVSFWAMFVSNFFFGIVTMILVLQVAHIVEVGFDPMLAATVSGLVGALTATGRLTGGIVSDRFGKPATGLFGVFILSLGAVTLIMARGGDGPWLLLAYGVFFGLGWGIFGIVGAAITGELFRGKSYGAVAGCLEIGVGLGALLGPWSGGFLFDSLGSYTVPFVIAVAAAIAGGLCFKFAYRGLSVARKRQSLELAKGLSLAVSRALSCHQLGQGHHFLRFLGHGDIDHLAVESS